uniref:Alanine transaminase n=1 Tax=Symphyocladia latiuscula TaxID=396806 RepID=A0A097IU08_9FLOR|nr:alanine transaminase [Symphyocladia latiuscula]
MVSPVSTLTADFNNSSSSTSSKVKKILTVPDGVNPALMKMEYAVRGPIVQRAEQLTQQLKDEKESSSVPFSQVVYCNIGNPQSVGQSPVTFLRQILSVLVCPSLINLEPSPFPTDVIERAKGILSNSNGIGAYTESPGLLYIRKTVANALTLRDEGIVASVDNIFLTNGASDGVKALLQLLIRSPNDGIMIPIPQYPLYSATLTSLKGTQVPYFLNEESNNNDKNWSLDINELQTSYNEAKRKGIDVRALVVINPGNPTGHVLSKDQIYSIIKFCEKNNLLILADEVYQANVFKPSKFLSFKKAVVDLNSDVEVASFHSVSKGVLGECGIRGGFVEVYNMEKDTRDVIYKIFSVSLCSNVLGQTAVSVMMNPPKLGDPSYEIYNKEVNGIFNSLQRKSEKLSKAFNSFEGVSCNNSQGAMYLFPKITMPEKAIQESFKQGFSSPDDLYCMQMLEQTGICTVPGSGFGQKEGTYHFRTTFLPPEDQIDNVIEQMRTFHEDFLQKYSH